MLLIVMMQYKSNALARCYVCAVYVLCVLCMFCVCCVCAVYVLCVLRVCCVCYMCAVFSHSRTVQASSTNKPFRVQASPSVSIGQCSMRMLCFSQ